MRKTILSIVIVLLVAACFAPAMAAKPDLDTNPVEPTPKLTGKDKVDTKVTGKDKADTGDEAGDEAGPEAKAKEKTKERIEKINQGQLMSAVTKARQEQFKLTKEQLKEMGYHGSVSDFATSFNVAVNEYKWQIRERLQEEDSNFTRQVVKNTMTRQLAEIREQLMAGITVDDAELPGEVGDLVEAEEGEIDPVEIEDALEAEIPYMRAEFKKKLALTMRNGTPEERGELALRVREFAQERVDQPPIEPPVIDPVDIRDQLEEDEPIDLEEIVAPLPVAPIDALR